MHNTHTHTQPDRPYNKTHVHFTHNRTDTKTHKQMINQHTHTHTHLYMGIHRYAYLHTQLHRTNAYNCNTPTCKLVCITVKSHPYLVRLLQSSWLPLHNTGRSLTGVSDDHKLE